VRILLSWAGIFVGVAGLAINAWLIFPPMMAESPTNPVARSLPDVFLYFWSYFTHLTNLWLVLVHLSVVTGAAALGFLRRPVALLSAATFILLVMLFYHFMLAPYYKFQGPLLLANYLLHYVAPVLYIVWWLVGAPHGSLRFANIPVALMPGVAYVAWVLARGAVVNEYPYDILDVTKAGYGGVAIGVAILLVAVAIFAALFVLIDRWLARRAARASA
jgi:hypothetical protein